MFENNTISMGLAIIGLRPDVAGVEICVRMGCSSVEDIMRIYSIGFNERRLLKKRLVSKQKPFVLEFSNIENGN